MAQALSLIEKELIPYRATFEEVLSPYPLSAGRLMRSVVQAYSTVPKLAECALQDIINCAQTAAYLGVIVDGVTGQAYILPFSDRRSGRMRAQLIIGYKGYVTIAAYGRMAVNADVVRQDDVFKVTQGTKPELIFERHIGHEDKRAITAAWAVASSYDRPPVFAVLSMDEILAIRARSQQWQSGGKGPWATDFKAMARKSAVRDLGRLLPLSPVALAAQMETLHEHYGVPVHITPDSSLVIDERVDRAAGENVATLPEPEQSLLIMKRDSTVSCRGIVDWRAKMLMAIDRLSPRLLAEFCELNRERLDEYGRGYPGDVAIVREAIAKKLSPEGNGE